MNISPIKFQNTFRSNEENVIAYDDEISKARRNYIRAHYYKNNMPYQSIYESQPRLGEYQLEILLDTLRNKPNMQQVGNSSIYRGKTLSEHPQKAFYNLKKMGIKNIVDLVDYGKTYEEKTLKAGMDYFVFNIFDNWWDRTDFESREYIDKLVKFLKKMQEGNIFIGCQYGSNDTDVALILNEFFNPKLEGQVKTTIPANDADFPVRLNTIYDAFSKADKETLGWTKEFEMRLIKKLTRL